MTRIFWVLVLTFSSAALGQSPRGYYRFPTIANETIVFGAEGDLWTVGIEGGVARRLTSHPGEESHPAISPDGRLLAFSATYEGPTEVYTMPVGGGLPTRRTWEAEASIAVGWTPEGRLVYATRAFSTLPDTQLVALDLENGTYQRVPLGQASDGVYDDRGRTLFFARPAYHRNNTKRYQGGTARNIWKFSRGAPEARNLTQGHPGENHSPMWWKGRVYYICDRDGTMNVWSMDESGRDHRQHTHHRGWDVISASLDRGRIVYRLGADLNLLDLNSGSQRKIPVTLASDFDQLREKWVSDPMEFLTSAHIHPEGKAVVLTARGRVFVAPTGRGRLVRATVNPGVRYRDAVYMPDGENLLALSDESGELEFRTLPANGVGENQTLTDNGRILRFRGHPSPDADWIAFADKNEDLWLLDVAEGRQTKVSTNREGVGEISWSPDSRWLAFSMSAPNAYQQVHLYNVADGTSSAITSDRVNSRSAAWSPDGKFLYFLSDRSLRSTVRSPWGPRAPEPFFDKSWKAYSIALRKGIRSPFRPLDETSEREAPSEKKGQAGSSQTPEVRIDLEGIAGRIRAVPLPPGNYRNLTVTGAALFTLAFERNSRVSNLMSLSIGPKDPKPIKVVEGVRGYQLSADGKKLMIQKGDSIYVIDAAAKAPSNLAKSKVDLAGWSFPIDVRADFRQLFIDAWRLERDYFYDVGMHGLDWSAMRDKYLPLVDRVTNRMELSDLIGQLVGELSALHVSVRGGEHREGPDRIEVATLGARLQRDDRAGGYRVEYIYKSDPDYPEERAPLSDPDLAIRAGAIIEAINGIPVLSVSHPNALLRNQKDRPVLLTVRDDPQSPSRQTVVTPVSRESDLRYGDWELTRRTRVEEKGAGQIGYVHLRAMGGRDLTSWYRNFYPVFNRAGLIIDVRHNRGGNIDSLILSKLLRRAWFYWKSRVGEPYWNMQYAFRGHMVVLCDENTASDGEAFAEGFRRLGLGKVIGTRTWGGEIWLSSNNRLTDGGLARAPQMGVYGPEGEWLIEGHGVDPDIVVDNLPHASFKGQDAQLDAAIRHLLEEIRNDPVRVPAPPPYPDKSGREILGETGKDGSGN